MLWVGTTVVVPLVRVGLRVLLSSSQTEDKMSDLRFRLYNRIVDLVCDAMVIALLLIAVGVSILPREMCIAVIGYALRSLVHPSLSLGIFTRNYTSAQIDG